MRPRFEPGTLPSPPGHGLRWSVGTETWLLAEGRLWGEGPVWVLVGRSGPFEGPTLVGLLPVVVVAEEGQIVEFGGSALLHGDHVVDLQSVGDATAGDHTAPVPEDEGGP